MNVINERTIALQHNIGLLAATSSSQLTQPTIHLFTDSLTRQQLRPKCFPLLCIRRARIDFIHFLKVRLPQYRALICFSWILILIKLLPSRHDVFEKLSEDHLILKQEALFQQQQKANACAEQILVAIEEAMIPNPRSNDGWQALCEECEKPLNQVPAPGNMYALIISAFSTQLCVGLNHAHTFPRSRYICGSIPTSVKCRCSCGACIAKSLSKYPNSASIPANLHDWFNITFLYLCC